MLRRVTAWGFGLCRSPPGHFTEMKLATRSSPTTPRWASSARASASTVVQPGRRRRRRGIAAGGLKATLHNPGRGRTFHPTSPRGGHRMAPGGQFRRSLVDARHLRTVEVVAKDCPVVLAGLGAPDGSGLAHAHSVPPATAPEDERRRSEEHTSELQSRPHLVCRLLLEKK